MIFTSSFSSGLNRIYQSLKSLKLLNRSINTQDEEITVMKINSKNAYRSAHKRNLTWFSLLCLFLTLSIAHQFFPGNDLLVTKAQGTLPEVFYTFIPFVN